MSKPRAPSSSPVAQQALDRDLDAGHVLLDEQRPVARSRAPGRRGARRPSASSARITPWLAASDRPASPRTGSRARAVGSSSTTTNAGLGHLAAAQRPPHRGLVAGGRHRVGRVVREARAARRAAARRPARPGRRPRPPRRPPTARRAPRSASAAASGSSSGHHHRPVAHRARQRLAAPRTRRPPRRRGRGRRATKSGAR